MSKVRNLKTDSANAQKGHQQENTKNSHTEETNKPGMQVDCQESEVKQAAPVTKEMKNNKATSKVSKRNAEAAAEKKESQMSSENGVHKSKNKKTENGEHSDKKSNKGDCNNGGVETSLSTGDSELVDIKLQLEEVQENDTKKSKANDESPKTKANGNRQDKSSLQDDEKVDKLSKKSEEHNKLDGESSKDEEDKEKSQVSDGGSSSQNLDTDATIILDDLQTNSKDKDELTNGEQSNAESFQNLSFGRTLRKITGRRSLSRTCDRNTSINSSMFVNTSMMSLNDEQFENKLSQYRSNLNSSSISRKRKAYDEEDRTTKRSKSDSDGGYSFIPFSFFQSLRRPVQVATDVRLTDNDKPTTEASKSRCLIM